MALSTGANASTEHFPDSEWIDFVHNLLSVTRASEMRAHVDEGCPECVGSLGLWKFVDQYSVAAAQCQPPERLLRAVEGLYSDYDPWRWVRESARWAQRVFDSLQQPSITFVRGPIRGDRHLVYEADPFTIDVTMRADPAQNSLLMLGQVLNSHHPEQAPQDVHVMVLSGEKLIAKTVAAGSGEFEVRCDAQPDLSLFISIRGERAIGLSLSESETAAAAGSAT
jgi:hypothetical protein